MEKTFRDCYCRWDPEAKTLVLGNDLIERAWSFASGEMVTTSLKDKKAGREWVDADLPEEADFVYMGLTGRRDRETGELLQPFEGRSVEAAAEEKSIFIGPNLTVVVELFEPTQGLIMKRELTVLPGVPAIRSVYHVQSENKPRTTYYGPRTRIDAVDTVRTDAAALDLISLELRARTDQQYTKPGREDLVKLVPMRLEGSATEPLDLEGNILLAADTPERAGLFFIKEGMNFEDQRDEIPGYFHVAPGLIRTLGWGIRQEEVLHDRARKSHASVLGVYSAQGGAPARLRNNGLAAIRRYHLARYPIEPKRDYIIQANLWGERNAYEHLNEAYTLAEIDACGEIGIEHYQMDSGWQKGAWDLPYMFSVNRNMINTPDFWEPDPQKYPRGFAPLVERCKKKKVTLAIWFSVDCNRHCRNWKEDVAAIVARCREGKIRSIKLDTLLLSTKEVEENSETIFAAVCRRLGGKVVFNIDHTLGKRSGFVNWLEYGNIAGANRYVQRGDYFPHRTLHNLWQLAHVMPPHKLCLEVPNLETPSEKYDAADPTRPANHSFEYAYAVAMFGCPLIWCEPSLLSERGRKSLRRMIRLHKKHRAAIYSGCIMPIGVEPNGRSWTGLQSHNVEKGTGYCLFFRETAEKVSCEIELKLLAEPNRAHRFRPVAEGGGGEAGEREYLRVFSAGEAARRAVTVEPGRFKITIKLPEPRSFALWRYERE